ncbi:MAG: hypothetical protein A3F12_08095 [Gammaproteobacteria bacterium RIFCSPHIGHO2_12_FULL_38_14]|nr:MAG: hypothetical protein A3F12_08095 [Gammaproteobacteria bacterium RIFCSPHIGHO2_12_FULL_38_14]
MQKLVRFGLAMLSITMLFACTSMNGHYTKNARIWQGKQANTLLTTFGKPDKTLQENGNTIYVYETINDPVVEPSYSPEIGINRRGGPVVIPPANGSRRGLITFSCTRGFVVNGKGLIIKTFERGAGC